MSYPNLKSFLDAVRRENELVEIDVEVDPYLELAEIHRRVISEGGPVLLFRKVRGSSFPLVSNLFGTAKRVDLGFGTEGERFVAEAAKMPEELMPPSFGKIWQKRNFFKKLLKIGIKQEKLSDEYVVQSPADLDELPIITSWKGDGGPFLTLPLVYTEHPDTHQHNLGMYRMHKYSKSSTGMHMQIGKGGGFHLSRAKELGRALPVNVFLGGPPSAIIAAISPLPENVPELLLASMLLGQRLRMAKSPTSTLPMLAEAEFVLVGSVHPDEFHPEGPFGDHYGYYSLEHDFPLFRCKAILHKKDAIYPATVVGKPRQEDFFIGDYLQKLLSPLFPLVMPAVKDLWSYGETGYHSLAAAVVKERYKREAMVSAFRILGEGQLALTKFLLVLDKEQDLTDFRGVLTYILERCDFRSDLFVFSNLSMDTLDYTGPKLNEGSKGVMLGIGDPIRELPKEFSSSIPSAFSKVRVFSPGCLVVSGPSYSANLHFPLRVAREQAFAHWPLIIVADDADFTAGRVEDFLWSVFTRFEPAADIHSQRVTLERFHPLLEPPIVIDCRMKPNYPDELFCDQETSALVDKRWGEYFSK